MYSVLLRLISVADYPISTNYTHYIGTAPTGNIFLFNPTALRRYNPEQPNILGSKTQFGALKGHHQILQGANIGIHPITVFRDPLRGVTEGLGTLRGITDTYLNSENS